MYDLLIRGATTVTAAGLERADVAVEDEKIVAVGEELDGTAIEEMDARGFYLFPGLIDAHVHFNEPGRTGWEGWATGSAALAAGGTTVVMEMPLNAYPPTTDGESFALKLEAAERSSLTDFAIWGGLVPGKLHHMQELAERGVIGFKAFMARSGTPDFEAADDLTLYEGMKVAASLSLPVAVHAESDTLTHRLALRAASLGETSMRDYMCSRPVVAELEAIGRAILFAQETGCTLHIVHVSTGRGIAMVAAAQEKGVDVSCETCPQYLILTEEDAVRIGAAAKCAPPLRAGEEREALWEHIFNGKLQMIASDHSPAPPGMKEGKDFFEIWGGISGGQTTLQLLLTEGYEGRNLPLNTLVSLTSGYVAQRFRLVDKGYMEMGTDADLTLVDLEHRSTLRSEDLLSRHKINPFIGMELKGRVVCTLVRGRTVFRDGRVVSKPVGKLVMPERRNG